MSRGPRIALSIAAALLIVLGLAYLIKGKEIRRLLAVNSLFAEENIVHNFSHMPELFFHEALDRGTGPVTAFEENPQELPELSSWVDERSLTAIVVLKDGELVHEDYFQETGEDDRRISWSVAKSYLSALTGILLDEGAIESIDDRVTKYVPTLLGGAYDQATIKDVLQMSSGVEFNEDYLNPKSDINRMGRALALGQSMDRFAENLRNRREAPGQHWQYVSIDTHVVGMVIEGATEQRVADLMSEKIIQPLGVEVDPIYITDKEGTAFVLGGLNMPTRDYARFGQMFLQDGEYNGTQIVPAQWVHTSTRPSANTEEDEPGYGYFWWTPTRSSDGEYFARGIYGQYIYVHEDTNTVIAINSTDRQFRDPGAHEQNLEMFREIRDRLNADAADQEDAAPAADDQEQPSPDALNDDAPKENAPNEDASLEEALDNAMQEAAE